MGEVVVVVAGQERVRGEHLGISSCLVLLALFVCSRVDHVFIYKVPCHLTFAERPSVLNHHPLSFLCQSTMPAKPSSTAGKAPASTASKAPAKTTSDTSKAAKKTSKAATSGGDGEAKKKRRKGRKETYSSYIYKGMCHFDAFISVNESS
jgi:hypothetical protein